MKIKNLKLSIILFIIFLFSLIFPPDARAQSFSLSLSPPLTELLIKPGKSVTQTYRITNNGDPAVLTPHIVPFTPDHLGNPGFNPHEGTAPPWFTSADKEISLDKPFFLNSNQSGTLNLNISIPENAEPGDYYFYVFFTSHPPAQELSSQITVEGSLGGSILISISRIGTLNKNAEIVSFSTPLFLDSFDRLEAVFTLKNTGAAFFKPLGKLTLKGLFLQSNYNFLPQNILTNTQKTLTTSANLSDETALAGKTLSLKGFFLGPYTLNSDLKLDGTNIELKKTLYIFAFPYKLTLIALVVFLILKKIGKI